MRRYVITADIAIHLVERGDSLAPDVKLVAPTLLRSQVVAILYRRVAAGGLVRKQAAAYLGAIRKLNIRLLGDRAMQARAWSIAADLGWPDTYDAEYVALTVLRADAFVTDNANLAAAVRHLVTLADINELIEA